MHKEEKNMWATGALTDMVLYAAESAATTKNKKYIVFCRLLRMEINW